MSGCRLAIMQPYLFPYLGYFQLAAAVDRFVFLDDVNFIQRGWINRNRLLFSGQVHYFTVPLAAASQNALIYEIAVTKEGGWKKKLDTSIRQSYAKAPHFKAVYALIESVLFGDERMIGAIAKHSVKVVADYLELPVEFVPSSAVYGNQNLKGEVRIRDICRCEQAGTYYNLPGGRALYDPGLFVADGIDLAFIEPALPVYAQFAEVFQPGLSILDVLMHNDPEAVRRMMQ